MKRKSAFNLRRNIMLLALAALTLFPLGYYSAQAAVMVVPVISKPSRSARTPIKARYLPQIIKDVDTRGTKVVALTFDDGPIGDVDPGPFCDALKKYNSKASFFMVGRRVSAIPQQAKTAAGCGEIANHSYSHLLMPTLDYLAQKREMSLTDNELTKAGLPVSPWFRPRGGQFDNNTRLALTTTGHKMVLWDVEGADPSSTTTSTDVKNNVLDRVHPGSIILLHQCTKTRDALPSILAGLKAKGYEVTTVSDLLYNHAKSFK